MPSQETDALPPSRRPRKILYSLWFQDGPSGRRRPPSEQTSIQIGTDVDRQAGVQVGMGPRLILFRSEAQSRGMSRANQVECATHGRGVEAFLCRHLVENVGLEFHRTDPIADNPQPDAWCRACEKIRRRAGGWERLDAASAPPIRLVCGHCYDIILARHLSAAFGAIVPAYLLPLQVQVPTNHCSALSSRWVGSASW